ncbi:hypothetical protein OIDMADRAFT_104156 [Oidiodendron maius Zn]|uniref:Uncharacterized protein n=1 Tax=Oidiodendron maius (strain Zn) TaxID=913774 RepID=A0A0C3CMI0_OIDMZ|nr:hypothetical protein OIDMADRAFT_104156 [Oidiodendron maius Zn]
MTEEAGLLTSFLAAVQASLSVLLVISYGALSARVQLLDVASAKAISKICVRLFLPALLFVKIGSELHSASASRYLIVLIWTFIVHLIYFLIGSLGDTGILNFLMLKGENTHDTIERAKSYFLVFAKVSSCLTFAVGPRMIDSEHIPDAQDDGDGDNDNQLDDDGGETIRHNNELRDRSLLLNPNAPQRHGAWWLLFLYDFLNAPLIGAVLGAIVGLVADLKKVFFSPNNAESIFTAWLTASLSIIGSVFIPLPVVIAGVSFYLSAQRPRSQNVQAAAPWLTTIFILVIRFLIWSFISIAVVFLLANKTNVVGEDPMLWFAMMLMPT